MKKVSWYTTGAISFLSLVSLIVFLTNYVRGTYLLGWDSTVPELNLPLNLSRFFFGVWQEYRGLGTQDGMAHTANITYWFLTWALSWLMPINMIRYVSTMLFHLLGGIGVYLLLFYDLIPSLVNSDGKNKNHFTGRKMLISLIWALFYQYNLMTIQMFYTPLELFSLHFAILPWGIWTLRRYLKNQTAKNLLIVFAVNLLSVSQAHVPTIFIPYAIIMGVFLIWWWLSQPRRRVRTFLAAGLVLFCVNAFWGLPFAYSAVTKSAEISNSKQNRLGTDGTFYRNLTWGNLKGVGTFGGFQLDYQDWSLQNQRFEFIMDRWVNLYHQPLYQVVAAAFSVMSLLGALTLSMIIFRQRRWSLTPFVVGWAFAVLMLATDVPGLQNITALFRTVVPLFYQIFRFTFTKFSLLYVFFASIMLGVFWVTVLCQENWPKLRSSLTVAMSIGCLAGLLYLSHPIFQGYFFYPALRVSVPSEYQEMFDYLNAQKSQFRVAAVPIPSLWGWTTGIHEWGYRGSGFIWQVIKQPLVDRSFDPWSKYNETMYLQMNSSLYEYEFPRLAQTFEKFHTSAIWYDKTIFSPGGYKAHLFTPEIEAFLAETFVRPVKSTANLGLFSIDTHRKNLEPYAPSSITLLDPLYQNIYTTRDQAFEDHGSYIQTEPFKLSYPFSFLQQDELKNLAQGQENIFSFQIPLHQNRHATIPPFSQTQEVLTAAIKAEDSNTASVYVNLPKITADSIVLSEPSPAIQLNASGSLDTAEVLLNENVLNFSSKSSDSIILSLPISGIATLSLYEETATNPYQQTNTNAPYKCGTDPRNLDSWCQDISITGTAQDAGLKALFFSTQIELKDAPPPEVCISNSPDSTTCLNKSFVLTSKEKEPGLFRFKTAIPNPTLNQYNLRLKWRQELGTSPWKNNLVRQYQKNDSQQIDVTSLIRTFDAKIAAVSQEESIQNITLDFLKEPFSISTFQNEFPRSSGLKNCREKNTGQVQKNNSESEVEYIIKGKAIGCETFYFPELDHRNQYLYHTSGMTKSGVGTQILLLNPYTKNFDMDTATRTGDFDLWVPVYPSFSPNNPSRDSFQLVFNSETFGRETNNVVFSESVFYPLPLKWLTSITEEAPEINESFSTTIKKYQKIGTSFYFVDASVSSNRGLLVIPQSFDAAWIALNVSQPSQIFQHLVYNGWANAWYLPAGDSRILVFYWPQLLSFLGYGFLIAGGGYLVVKSWRNR